MTNLRITAFLLVAACSSGGAKPAPTPAPSPTASGSTGAAPGDPANDPSVDPSNDSSLDAPPVATPSAPAVPHDCAYLRAHVDRLYPLAGIADADVRAVMTSLVAALVPAACSEADAARFELSTGQTQMLDEHVKFMSDALAKPAEITCARVAAAYYSNIHWNQAVRMSLSGSGAGESRDLRLEESFSADLLPNYTAAETRKLIASTRAAFAKACTDEAWSPAVRACLRVTVYGTREGWCLDAIEHTPAHRRRWTAPPLDLVSIYEPDCDAMLADARAVWSCPVDDDLDSAYTNIVSMAQAFARPRASKKRDSQLSDYCKLATMRLKSARSRACP